MTNHEEWLNVKIAYINGLKSPSKQQRLLVLLAEKENRTTTGEKTLSALTWAEKTAEKAAAAKARVTAIIVAERKATARAERKVRDHELYKAAGLTIVAGLVDSKTGKLKFSAAELVGAFAGIAEPPRNHPKWQEWERHGKELLAKDSAREPPFVFRSPGASSLIHSLCSVMRLRRAQPPQSCGKPHYYWVDRGEPPESPLLKRMPRGAVT